MRNSFDAEPRLMALTEADLAAQRVSPTWMLGRSGFSPTLLVGLKPDPQTRWSRHARRAAYWTLGEIVRRPR
jgi:hypothetical protein